MCWRLDRFAAVLFGAASLSHCLAPTEIVLWLSTDVACSDVTANGVEVAVGEPGTDSVGAQKVGAPCGGDGGLGSLVVVPSGAITDGVGIRVVLGVTEPTDQCATDASGCIVARRELPFSPHTPLVLPIALESDCIGRICDPNTTCVANTCVDAGAPCTGTQCDLPDAAPPVPDAGAICLAATPVQVSGTTAAAMTPRIVKSGNTYTVLYVTTMQQVHAVSFVIQPDGTLSPPNESTLLTPMSYTIAAMGPAATDGTNYGFVLTDTASGAEINMRDPMGKKLQSVTVGPGSAALEGMVYQAAPGFFVTALAEGSIVDVYAFAADAGVTQPTGQGSGTGHVSLSEYGGTYYVAYTNSGGCQASSMTWTGTVFSGAIPLTQPATVCGAVKVAANGTFVAEAYTDAALNLLFSGVPIGMVATADAFVPFSTTAALEIVWYDPAGALEHASFPAQPTTPPAPVTLATISGSSSKGFTPFDVVPDDATNATTFGLAYFENGVVKFIHVCP